jgi:hypothetical protein
LTTREWGRGRERNGYSLFTGEGPS